MKVAFMGSPKFAATVLDILLKSDHKVVCVVTQPDAEVGRGHKIKFNPVKELAMREEIAVLQPKKISLDTKELESFAPDILVTCAFGQILRQNILDLAEYGVINVHGSLLPAYRGAAPIQWAVINGDKKTGITIAKTELGLDCGEIIEKVETDIMEYETSGELFERLAPMAGEVLVKALDKIQNKTAIFVKQDESEVTHAPMLSKEMGKIDWKMSALKIANLVHGLNPWPRAFVSVNGEIIKINRVSVLNGKGKPGSIVSATMQGGLVVACGSGLIGIEELQPAGKRVMTAAEFLNGYNKTIAID